MVGSRNMKRFGMTMLAPVIALTMALPAFAETMPAAAPGEIASPAPAAPHWSKSTAEQLLAIIDAASAEGLRPADYRPAALRRAIAAGDGAALDAAADMAALALAHDYLLGRVGDRETLDWYIQRPMDSAASLPAALEAAVAADRLAPFFASLLPTDPRYATLRDALAAATEPAERNALRANMERWRWMPRSLGENYLYVNVPSYRLDVVDGGIVNSTYTVVVGAPDTPTPQIASDTGSLVVNPWWNVPQSIVRKSALRPGRAGFIFKASADGWQVRQPPGPRNSLGRIKFNLVNDQAIYLHDTPAKALFARTERALSHGCIRVKNIDRLATELMEDGTGTDRLDDALAGKETRTLRLARSWPVYLVYFTIDRGADGQLVRYRDPYGRDAAVIARLDGTGMQMASN